MSASSVPQWHELSGPSGSGCELQHGGSVECGGKKEKFVFEISKTSKKNNNVVVGIVKSKKSKGLERHFHLCSAEKCLSKFKDVADS